MRDFQVLATIANAIRPLAVGLAPFSDLPGGPYLEEKGTVLSFEGICHVGDVRDAAVRGIIALTPLEPDQEDLTNETVELLYRALQGLEPAYLIMVGLLHEGEDDEVVPGRPAVVRAQSMLGSLHDQFSDLYKDVLAARDRAAARKPVVEKEVAHA